MYIPRDYFMQNSCGAGNFSICQTQDLNRPPVHYLVNNGINLTRPIDDTMHDRWGSFVERLGCYGMKAKGAIASIYYNVNEKKEIIIDGFEDVVRKINHRSAKSEDWGIKDNIIDTFENIVDKSKRFSLLTKKRVGITNLKEQAIDNFEAFVDRSKMLSLQTKNKLRKVTSVKETLREQAVENFEHFVDKSKDLGSLRKKFKFYADERKEDIVEGFEEIFQEMKVNTNNKAKKVESLKEEVIDEFEDLVQRIKTKIMDLEGNVKCFTEEKGEDLVEEFEELVCKMKNFGKSIVERTNDQVVKVNCVKEEIVDSFENLLTRLNDFGFRTDKEIREKLDCIKEEIVDDFENLVERFNINLKCAEDNACKNQAFIVDQFEDIIDDVKHEINCIDFNIRMKIDEFFDDFEYIFDDTKCIFENKTNLIFGNAECALEQLVGQMEEVYECGKIDVETELLSVKHWLCMGEMVVKDFLCYSERMVEDFCRFSEKRMACFLCQGKNKAKVFYNEVVDSLVRGFEDKLLCDNLVLEINSSRYAYNVTMSEVNFHVVRALLTLPGPDGRSWQHVVSRLSYFMPILTNYIRTETAQKECLLAIEDVAGSHPEIFAVLVKIIHWLYEKDILSEDIILDWYNNPCADADPDNSNSVRLQVAPFIRWLQEAEEDDDDDDDDD